MSDNLKMEVVEEFLDDGKVQLVVLGKHEGVSLPENVRTEFVRVNISRAFRDAQMVINDRGVAASLSFDGKRFRCILPWDSIIAAISIYNVSEFWGTREQADLVNAARRSPSPALTKIDGEKKETSDDSSQKRERPSWLRVVK